MLKSIVKKSAQKAIEIEQAMERIFSEKIEPRLKSFLGDDSKIRRIAGFVYRVLPFFIRIFVSKDRFVDFVSERSNRYAATNTAANAVT